MYMTKRIILKFILELIFNKNSKFSFMIDFRQFLLEINHFLPINKFKKITPLLF